MWKLNDFQEAQADLGETPLVDFIVMKALFKDSAASSPMIHPDQIGKIITEM